MIKTFCILVVLTATTNFSLSQQSWQSIGPGTGYLIRGLYFLNETTGIAGLYKTTNSGTNWVLTNQPTFRYHFVNGTTGYSNFEGCYKTTNLGSSWTFLPIPTSLAIFGVFFLNGDTGFMSGEAAEFLKTTNGGWPWVELTNNIPNNPFLYDIFFFNSDTGFVCGYDGSALPGIVSKTIDGGINWVTQNFAGENGLSKIQFVNHDTGIAIGKSIIRTTNSGANWIHVSSPISVYCWDFYFSSSNTGYAACYNGEIIKSTDAGLSWFRLNSGITYNLWSVYFINDLTGYVCGEHGTIMKTTDGGGPPFGITPISGEVPKNFSLSQNYPNPFNPSTKINFSLPKKSLAKIIIYDALGKMIDELVNFDLSAGTYSVDWNASSQPSGVYFYRLIAGSYTETKRMVLLK